MAELADAYAWGAFTPKSASRSSPLDRTTYQPIRRRIFWNEATGWSKVQDILSVPNANFQAGLFVYTDARDIGDNRDPLTRRLSVDCESFC